MYHNNIIIGGGVTTRLGYNEVLNTLHGFNLIYMEWDPVYKFKELLVPRYDFNLGIKDLKRYMHTQFAINHSEHPRRDVRTAFGLAGNLSGTQCYGHSRVLQSHLHAGLEKVANS